MSADLDDLLLPRSVGASCAPAIGVDVCETAAEFRDLLVSVLPALRQQAMTLSRHRADAEDLVHSTISSALAAQTSFEAGTNFRAWIARNLRNHFFTNCRRRRYLVELEGAPESQIGRTGGQEELIAFQDLQRHLLRLPPKQCESLLMIALDGLSYEEGARRLGIAVGTLKNRVFRARSKLQFWMSGESCDKRTAATSDKRQRVPPVPVVALQHSDASAARNRGLG